MQVQGGGISPASNQIGYNAAKVNALMAQIDASYKALASKVRHNYQNLKPVLRREWVGEDELDFEKKLVDRLNTLYYNAGLLSQAGINAIYNVAESWKAFQSKNVFGEEGTTVQVNATFDEITIKPVETIITFVSETYDNDVNRGLQNGSSSYSNIMQALEEFKSQCQADAKEFTSEFDINSAFFGETERGVQRFIDHLENCLYLVMTAVKDFVEGLKTLAKSNYTSATTSVSDFAESAKGEVDKFMDDAANSSARWTSE